MSNDTNEQPTAKLADFGLGHEDTATDAASTPTAATLPLPGTAQGPTATATGGTPANGGQAPPPEAEPAWLGGWGNAPQRTTPRIRWAGIIWGLVFIATGWFALWTLGEQGRRAAFSDWVLTLSNGGWAIVAAFALGGLLLVLGLIAALRAATRPRP